MTKQVPPKDKKKGDSKSDEGNAGETEEEEETFYCKEKTGGKEGLAD